MSEPLLRAISAHRAGQSNAAAPAKCTEADGVSSLFELEADVSFFDQTYRGGEREAASDKDGLAIADAEWFAACEPIEKVLGQIAEENFRLALQGRRQHGPCEPGRAVELHSFAQEAHSVGRHREPDGVGVAAEAREEWVGRVDFSMDCSEGVEEVEAFDGAAGAVGMPIFVGEDEGRASGAVDYA